MSGARVGPGADVPVEADVLMPQPWPPPPAGGTHRVTDLRPPPDVPELNSEVVPRSDPVAGSDGVTTSVNRGTTASGGLGHKLLQPADALGQVFVTEGVRQPQVTAGSEGLT